MSSPLSHRLRFTREWLSEQQLDAGLRAALLSRLASLEDHAERLQADSELLVARLRHMEYGEWPERPPLRVVS